MLADVRLPFMTLPHPVVSGEGALDPLGLARAGDALADWLVPGMTARMGRPRFLTAMAISAAVCEGLEDRTARDGVTPAYLVFEWLLVEAFARAAARDDVLRTPGIEKARTALLRQIPMSASAYLKTPSVFGFHGVYRRLAVATDIVDEDVRLGENGYRLLKAWERDQGLEGFVEGKIGDGLRGVLRSAIEDGLANGYVSRSGAWQGWQFFAKYLTPARIGRNEAETLRGIMVDARGETRGELFDLLREHNAGIEAEDADEATIGKMLLGEASRDLTLRLKAIFAFERFAVAVETAFDLLRYLSSQNPAKALSVQAYASDRVVTKIATQLRGLLEKTARAVESAPPRVGQEFGLLEQAFESVAMAKELYAAILERHARVQKEKPPEGKREWFEHSADGGVMVRTPFRLIEQPELHDAWNRPYRLHALRSFREDLGTRR